PAAGGGGARPAAAGARSTVTAGGGMPIPVVTAPVQIRELTRALTAVGTARANEAVEITAKSTNIVTRILFNDGQRVRAGDVLVELDSAQARADLAAAQAAVTESTSQYQRSRELLTTQALSQSQFEQLEAAKLANEARLAAARARLEDTVIRAPFNGRVGLRRVSVGTLISPGTTITTLDDTSTIKLDFAVPENAVASLRTGLPISARSNAYPGRHFEGTVASIDSRVDPTTRAVAVRVLLPNHDGALRPGMFMTVELQSERRQALVIPEEALVPEATRQYVYVVRDGSAARREVTIGAREPGSVEVLSGLTAGERVVVEGTIRIRDGVAVRDLASAQETGAVAGRNEPAVAVQRSAP
ncbi:MAG: efflux RND transporter periplasmic adaptor subunit, partial [Steroidobacteraceae bacterium]|nr:efflux RND transporter periplasmic adaptor subunit [Steroidobacteraceae bacterium]